MFRGLQTPKDGNHWFVNTVFDNRQRLGPNTGTVLYLGDESLPVVTSTLKSDSVTFGSSDRDIQGLLLALDLGKTPNLNKGLRDVTEKGSYGNQTLLVNPL